MPVGPGKYDDLATYVREAAHALGVVVLILGGKKGEGFSVQAPAIVQRQLPGLLRTMADQIEHDMEGP